MMLRLGLMTPIVSMAPMAKVILTIVQIMIVKLSRMMTIQCQIVRTNLPGIVTFLSNL